MMVPLKSGVCGAPERYGQPQEQPSPTTSKAQAGSAAKAIQEKTYKLGLGGINLICQPLFRGIKLSLNNSSSFSCLRVP